MKQFFEEYGGVSLGILAVLVLVAIVNPVGGGVKNSLTGITKGFDDKMKNGLNNSGFGFGGDSLPEQTISLATGQKITIGGKEYTVIENVQDNQYKVLATDLANNGEGIAFDDNSNDYKTSTIATYLDNDYYNSLPENIKNAIVETPIQQKISSTGYDNGKNSPTWTGEVKEGGAHKVFIPSWDEFTKVAGGTDATTLGSFMNSLTICLRDTHFSYVLYVNYLGTLKSQQPISVYNIRPAMVIDLSKINFAIK